MKRRELLKLADGSTLTLVPAVGSWVSAGTVPEVDNMVRIKGPNVTSNELVDARKLNQNYLKLRKSRW